MNTIRADLLRYCNPAVPYAEAEWDWWKVAKGIVTLQGVWATLEYRFRSWIRTLPTPLQIPLRILAFVPHKSIEVFTGISIDSRARFGPGLYIGHFGGIIVGGDVVVGENCNISQGVTLGEHHGSPTIGNRVYIAPGAKVFGPLTVGDDVSIGANAVVTRDVPPFSTAVGVPARVVDRRPAGGQEV